MLIGERRITILPQKERLDALRASIMTGRAEAYRQYLISIGKTTAWAFSERELLIGLHKLRATWNRHQLAEKFIPGWMEDESIEWLTDHGYSIY